jgi:oxygen-independent coproporphyrinogen-3 oxidase
MAGIYFHIPFCKQACHYCNFHFSTSLKLKEGVIDSMLKELQLRADYLNGQSLETIYFGGGTPSLLDERELSQLFNEVYRLFDVNEDAEITLEANPDDLSKNKLEILARTPVNRLSIGVQSFHEAELSWMNRAHSAEESFQCLEDAKLAGFDNISMDLIFGIPMSSHELWDENLRRTIEFEIPHVSSYALTVEDGTALGHWVKKGKEVEAKDDYVMQQFDRGVEVLEDAGYVHYEISNFALPGREAVHNSNYWRSKPYLGIGPSAHSFNVNSRTMNVANNAKYIKAMKEGLSFSETEKLDAETKYNEYVMTRIRTIWGIDQRDLGVHADYFNESVKDLLKKDWVYEEEGIYRLTRKGKHFADAVAADLFLA